MQTHLLAKCYHKKTFKQAQPRFSRHIEYSLGLVGEYAGEVGEYAGEVGEYAGLVGEYAGEVGEYPATQH